MTDTIKISELPELATIKESTIIPVVDSGLNKTISGGTLRNYISGLPGQAGPTGPRGTAGQQGYTGSQGISGYVGSRGPVGATGISGYNGARGYTGSAGTDALWNFLGVYGNTIAYAEGSVVTYQSQTWYRLGVDNQAVGFAPGISNSYWRLIAAKGADGAAGTEGYVGSRGIVGYTGSTGVGYTGSIGPTGPAWNLSQLSGTSGLLQNDGSGNYTWNNTLDGGSASSF